MTIRSSKLGKTGEELAEHFLKTSGYKVLETNYRNCFGEIDIIAKYNEIICFIEVKTRATDKLGSPFEAVTLYKQRKLIKTAQGYLQEKELEDESSRFDVIGIWTNANGKKEIDIIKDAFSL